MNKKKIESYIPKALHAIKSNGFIDKESNTIPNEYKGYIASFGASIVTNGLLPAIAFFQKQGDAQASREKITDAILYILTENNNTTLLEYTIANLSQKSEIQNDIMSASVALKLAMRTFPFSAQKEEKHE